MFQFRTFMFQYENIRSTVLLGCVHTRRALTSLHRFCTVLHCHIFFVTLIPNEIIRKNLGKFQQLRTKGYNYKQENNDMVKFYNHRKLVKLRLV